MEWIRAFDAYLKVGEEVGHLHKLAHQQIEIKNEVIFFHIIDQLNPIVLAFSFLLQYSCKDNACIQMEPPIYILVLMLFTDFGF
jgi:hypothetical protein